MIMRKKSNGNLPYGLVCVGEKLQGRYFMVNGLVHGPIFSNLCYALDCMPYIYWVYGTTKKMNSTYTHTHTPTYFTAYVTGHFSRRFSTAALFWKNE